MLAKFRFTFFNSKPHRPFAIRYFTPHLRYAWSQWQMTAKGKTQDYLLVPINNKLKYDDLLNHSTRSILAFGMGVDGYVPRYRAKGWKMTGYDFTQISADYMAEHKVEPRIHDLNAMTPACVTDVMQDLAQPTNILCLRLLQYLNEDARQQLLFLLMQQAKPGSIFFIINGAYAPESQDADREEKRQVMRDQWVEQYHVLSFFAPRTDIDILQYEKIQTEHYNSLKASGALPQDCNYFYEFMMMRKR